MDFLQEKSKVLESNPELCTVGIHPNAPHLLLILMFRDEKIQVSEITCNKSKDYVLSNNGKFNIRKNYRTKTFMYREHQILKSILLRLPLVTVRIVQQTMPGMACSDGLDVPS